MSRAADAVEFAPEDGDIWYYLLMPTEDTEEIKIFPLNECSFVVQSVTSPMALLRVRSGAPQSEKHHEATVNYRLLTTTEEK